MCKNMPINEYFKTKSFKIVVIIIAALIILLSVFKAGVLVGYRKAGFSFRWDDNYHRNFGGPRGDDLMRRGLDDRDFLNAGGANGEILKIDGESIIVKDRRGEERAVLVTGETEIRLFRDKIKLADLRIGDNIVTIGEPNNDGKIEAKLIRVMPMPMPMQRGGGQVINQNQDSIIATSTK